jgi:hypothetical protein
MELELNDALDLLNENIDKRFEKEQLFIDRMVKTFDAIRNQMVETNPKVLERYITRIGLVTDKLANDGPFGNVDEAVQQITRLRE